MSAPKFHMGQEVFTRDPGKFISNARALTGFIRKITPVGKTYQYEFDAGQVAVNTGPGISDFVWRNLGIVTIPEHSLGDRSGGYRLSELSGRNGGNAAWKELSASWGYI